MAADIRLHRGDLTRFEADATLPDALPAGQSVATGAGELPARWVIHTVGPVYSHSEDRSATLSSCYRAFENALSSSVS